MEIYGIDSLDHNLTVVADPDAVKTIADSMAVRQGQKVAVYEKLTGHRLYVVEANHKGDLISEEEA